MWWTCFQLVTQIPMRTPSPWSWSFYVVAFCCPICRTSWLCIGTHGLAWWCCPRPHKIQNNRRPSIQKGAWTMILGWSGVEPPQGMYYVSTFLCLQVKYVVLSVFGMILNQSQLVQPLRAGKSSKSAGSQQRTPDQKSHGAYNIVFFKYWFWTPELYWNKMTFSFVTNPPPQFPRNEKH